MLVCSISGPRCQPVSVVVFSVARALVGVLMSFILSPNKLVFAIWQRVVSVVVICYIVDHYCLRFDREWFVLWWLVILLTTTVWGLPEEWCVLLWLVILQTITVRSTREVICALMVGYITDHSSLKFTREVVCNIVDY